MSISVISRKERPILAQNVKRLRENRGWLPAGLAQRAGMAQSTIHDIERGCSSSQIRTVAQLAAAFELADYRELLQDEPAIPLVAQLIQANYNSYSSVTQRLINDYQREVDELKATLYLVREVITEALGEPYAPSAKYIEVALYPDKEDIEAVATRYEQEREGPSRLPAPATLPDQ